MSTKTKHKFHHLPKNDRAKLVRRAVELTLCLANLIGETKECAQGDVEK